MGSVYDYAKDHAGEIAADIPTMGGYSTYKAVTGQGGMFSDAYHAADGATGGALGGIVGAVTPASTDGVQQAAGDAKSIQDQFLAQYQGLQPGQAPITAPTLIQRAAQTGSATASAANPVTAAQMQAAQLNGANLSQDRAAQLALAQSLQGTIAGQTPSVAQIQQGQAFDRIGAQQAGLAAAMGRGGNQALAMRTAMQNQGNAQAQAASQAALLRAQETATAQGQLGGLLGQVQGADVSVAGQNAQLSQGANQTNAQLSQQAALTNQANQQAVNQQNAQLQQAAMSQNATLAQQVNLANQQAGQQTTANNQQSMLQTRSQDIAQQQNLGQLTLGANQNQVNAQVGALNAQTAQKAQTSNLLATGLGAAATFSDRRLKEDVSALGRDDITAFLEAIHPAAFRYKGQPQTHAGVMAQDVEKSPVGRTLVKDVGGAKAIDTNHATTALMAALADMHQRVKKLEGGR